MKFCAMIIQDINFEPDRIQPCCNVHNIKVPSIPFTGGGIDLSLLSKYVSDTVRELQGEDSILCRGCPNLIDIEPQKGFKLKFKTVSINHFRNWCNCKCVYCNFWKKIEKPSYSVLPAIKSLYENNLLTKNCFFSWGGGESSILPEFEETSKWIHEHKFFQHIHTSAIKYSPMIEEALRKGLCNVEVSLDAGTPETHERVKGLDVWSKVLTNCINYHKNAQNQQAFTVKYIVFEENNDIQEITSFVKLCEKLNFRNIEVSLNFKEVSNNTLSQKTLDAARYLYHFSRSRSLKCGLFFVNEPYYTQITT